jgi:hypothetical protein
MLSCFPFREQTEEERYQPGGGGLFHQPRTYPPLKIIIKFIYFNCACAKLIRTHYVRSHSHDSSFMHSDVLPF